MIPIKTEKQIQGIRESGKLLAELFRALEKRIEPGAVLLDLDKFAYQYITERGGEPAFLGYMGFPASLCISVNEEVIHGIPGKRKLKPGDIVGIDCGVKFNRYYSDSAVTYPVGDISAEAEALLKVTRESLAAGIEAAKAGNRIKDISRAVYRYNKDRGYGVVRQFCGHGIGLEIHESPQIPNYVGPGPNPRLKPGMVLAIEPMINIGTDEVYIGEDDWTVFTDDGTLSAHFEHTIAIYRDRTEILTI
ncbi:MAG: type I methionyl aminopeptidase [Spirochaetia bacterium]